MTPESAPSTPHSWVRVPAYAPEACRAKQCPALCHYGCCWCKQGRGRLTGALVQSQAALSAAYLHNPTQTGLVRCRAIRPDHQTFMVRAEVMMAAYLNRRLPCDAQVVSAIVARRSASIKSSPSEEDAGARLAGRADQTVIMARLQVYQPVHACQCWWRHAVRPEVIHGIPAVVLHAIIPNRGTSLAGHGFPVPTQCVVLPCVSARDKPCTNRPLTERPCS